MWTVPVLGVICLFFLNSSSLVLLIQLFQKGDNRGFSSSSLFLFHHYHLLFLVSFNHTVDDELSVQVSLLSLGLRMIKSISGQVLNISVLYSVAEVYRTRNCTRNSSHSFPTSHSRSICLDVDICFRLEIHWQYNDFYAIEHFWPSSIELNLMSKFESTFSQLFTNRVFWMIILINWKSDFIRTVNRSVLSGLSFSIDSSVRINQFHFFSFDSIGKFGAHGAPVLF